MHIVLLYKTIFTVIWMIITISLTHTFVISSQFINKSNKFCQIAKESGNDLGVYILMNVLKANILYSGNLKKKDKISVIIANHPAALDFLYMGSLLNHFKIKDFFYTIRGNNIFKPKASFALILSLDRDIKVYNNWEKDINQFNKQLDNINSGFVIIYPEGMNYSKDRYKKSLEFGKKNNIPIYKNLLIPRIKGTWYLIKYLKQNNKLDYVYDISFINEKFFNKKNSLFNSIKNDIGDVYSIIKNCEIPRNDNLNNYDNFKNWFFNEFWLEKDKRITNYKKLKYKNFKYKKNIFNYFILFFLIIIFIYLIKRFNYKYLIISYLLCYLIVLYKYYN